MILNNKEPCLLYKRERLLNAKIESVRKQSYKRACLTKNAERDKLGIAK